MEEYRGPVPSFLVALSRLHMLPVGTKVRFLGCVTRYDLASGILVVQHSFPLGANFKALIDINLLHSLKGVDTDIGSWINVIGYIAVAKPGGIRVTDIQETSATSVQAIVLWPAGSINIKEYEKTISDHQAEYNQALAIE